MAASARPGLLRDRDFGRLFVATALGQFGDRVVFPVLPFIAIAALDADEFQVGLLAAMTSAGSFLVGLPAGAWVDRVRKRPVMIVTDLARALVLATVPVGGYLPHLVGRDNVVEGNAKLSAVRSVTSIRTVRLRRRPDKARARRGRWAVGMVAARGLRGCSGRAG